MASKKLTVIPIDIEKTRETCVRFRKDSFFVSFGNNEAFSRGCGQNGEKYVQWLKSKIERDPGHAVHFTLDEKIIGQMEIGLFKLDPSVGYVNLYYLAPEYRGKGLGRELDSYATEFFRERSFKRLLLSVSPTNRSAVLFYEKMGWKDLGPRENMPEVHLMEKLL